MDTFRSGNLVFRKPLYEDVEQLCRLKNNKEASKLLGGTAKEYSAQDIYNWIDFHNSRNDERLFVIYDENVDKLIGHVGLYKIDEIAKKAEFGILIADDDSRGKGYGTMCTNAMVEYAFNCLGLHKVFAEVISENIPSKKMFLKCGFELDGILRDDNYKNGRFYDVLVLSIIASDRS